MDPRKFAQDVLRCHLCDTPVPPLYCDSCNINLCRQCAGEHLCDESREHRVLPIRQRWSPSPNFPKCSEHPTNQGRHHCEQCNIPICALCVSSKKHNNHEVVDMMKKFQLQKEVLKKDLEELEKSIYPNYEKASSRISFHKTALSENSKVLISALKKRGEEWHREINLIIKNFEFEINETESKHLVELENQEGKVNCRISDISQTILDLRKLLISSDVCMVSEYKSRIAEFRKLPPQLKINLQNISFETINERQLSKQFGSLTKCSITLEEEKYIAQGVELSVPSGKTLMDKPKILTTINTEITPLYNVTCSTDEEIWTSGGDKIMKLFNIQGDLLKSMQTESEYTPQNIAVTMSGNLIYADLMRGSIMIMINEHFHPRIRLSGWSPYGICCTSTDELLVIMNTYDCKQTKVVRYSGLDEKQSIQWDDKFQPLFSSGDIKYIRENANLDICVADNAARAIVVVSASGRLRFKYTGPRPAKIGSFDPVGITTDSQSRILTADGVNKRILIVDQDGNFICYIDSCDLGSPWGLCVDSRNNLFVAECQTGKVKKIQYCK